MTWRGDRSTAEDVVCFSKVEPGKVVVVGNFAYEKISPGEGVLVVNGGQGDWQRVTQADMEGPFTNDSIIMHMNADDVIELAQKDQLTREVERRKRNRTNNWKHAGEGEFPKLTIEIHPNTKVGYY